MKKFFYSSTLILSTLLSAITFDVNADNSVVSPVKVSAPTASPVGAQQSDSVVVMRIDGKDIYADEFCYHYRKTIVNGTLQLTPRDFANSFALFKMKVMEAEMLAIDTLPSFRKELDYYSLSIESDNDMLSKEYRDGMLLYEISLRHVWDTRLLTGENLAGFFQNNRDKYSWNEPRAKGWILYADDEETIKAARKCLDETLSVNEEGVRELATMANDVDLKSLLTSRFGKKIHAARFLVKEGINPMIDALVFKGEEYYTPENTWKIACPYCCRIINNPEEWTDVKGEVTEDFQQDLNEAWEKELWRTHDVQFYFDTIDEVIRV